MKTPQKLADFYKNEMRLFRHEEYLKFIRSMNLDIIITKEIINWYHNWLLDTSFDFVMPNYGEKIYMMYRDGSWREATLNEITTYPKGIGNF